MTALEREGRQPSRSARRLAGWLVGALAAAFAAGWLYLGVLHPVVTVMTPSMVPTLHVGDVALMESLRGSPPKVGQIVLVPVPLSAQQKQGYPPTVTHRIVAIRNGIITTKGDGRPAPDPFTVPAASVHERMLTVVPGAGRVLQFAVSPFGLVWLAFGVILFAGPKLLAAVRSAAPAFDDPAIARLAAAIEEYGVHLQSHTAILQSMSAAAQDLAVVTAGLRPAGVGPRVADTSLPPPAFEEGIAALAAFQANHRTGARVPSAHVDGSGFPLGAWLAAQRRAARTGALAPDRRRRLEELGVEFQITPVMRAREPGVGIRAGRSRA